VTTAPATIHDVAKAAGVSVATVSRALNGAGNVLPETRRRVEEAARALRFTPSSAARSLITRRTDTIGALLPDLHGEYFSELIRGIDQAARARASVILRGLANGSLRQTVAQVQPLIGQRQVAVQIDPQAFDRFAIARVPSFVLVRDGTRPESCAAGSCAPPEAFLRTAGDVSLDYALEHMQRAAPAFRADAAPFLARLRN